MSSRQCFETGCSTLFTIYQLYKLVNEVRRRITGLYQRIKGFYDTHFVMVPKRIAELEARIGQLETENTEVRAEHEKLTRLVNLIAQKTDANELRSDPAAVIRSLTGKYKGVASE